MKYVEKVNRPLNINNNKHPLISIFSGVLGMDLGLERAGFETHFALDIDKHCKDVVEDNRDTIGDFPYLIEDINNLEPEDILKIVDMEPGEVSLLSGGPPCQPFSKSGLRKGIEDDRGLLFKRYLEYLEVIQPKAFILENVRGLYSSRKGEDFKLILKLFEESGYTIYWKIIDAANYGVPQFRQRLFIVGFRDRIKYKFPEETHFPSEEIEDSLFEEDRKKSFTTVSDAIGDLVGKVTYPSYNGQYAHLLEEIPEGMNYSYYTEERGYPNPVFKWRSKFWYFLLKIDRTRPSLTIQAQPGNNTGPFHWENRKLAIDEIKRLQSFPDWLSIEKSYQVAHRMIGNAVPPLLSEVLGTSIIKALEQNEKINKEEFYKLRDKYDKKAAKVRSGRGSGKGKVKVNVKA